MKKYTVRLNAAEAPMSMFRDSEVDARASMLSACEPSIASWLTWKASERQERRPASLYAAIMTAYDAAKAQVVLKDQHIEPKRPTAVGGVAPPPGGRPKKKNSAFLFAWNCRLKVAPSPVGILAYSVTVEGDLNGLQCHIFCA